ncbi:MAG: formate dehydrogenase accessory sulfurtransferase FdhD [Candidatus Bathyarchaeota archaeon]|nr:MAG: formate dehydrogenase accessory sulfurtransferase FdhD [Candidatus Bathyarchaeota archaeon]
MKEVPISRIDVFKGTLEQKKDHIAEEAPLHIFLDKTHYATILCTPSQLKELAIGHLISEGILKTVDEIREIRLETSGKCQVRLKSDIDAEKRIPMSRPFARLIVSACGSPDSWPITKLMDRLDLPIVPNLSVKAKVVLESVKELNRLAGIFRNTGGVHIAALYSVAGDLVVFAEDVGRHNAVDKVIGSGISKGIEFGGCFLASSGRLTGDIVLKCARMRIPIVASLAAAINSGIDVAQRTGITLVGFVRGKRMNVYTYPKRITY